jgi:predicted enzyme related to lactoylglutathione lyase
MKYPHGLFTWTDVALSDPKAGGAFYAAVFGWDVEDVSPEPGSPYWFFTKADKVAAGMGTLTKEQQDQGVPPMWTSYVNVKDVAATVAKAKGLGATILMEPMQIFTSGKMAYLMDPTGAAVALWEAGDHEGAEEFNAPGFLCWNELATRDVAAATEFYAALFGWSAQTQDMGGGMEYTVVGVGDRSNGGIYDASAVLPDSVPAHWTVYLTVEDCDAAAAAVAAEGGTLLQEPFDVRGVGRMAACADPQGATFMVLALAD